MTTRKRTKRTRRGVKAVGQVQGVPGPLILATDAAVDRSCLGVGFLATSGHYGLQGHPYGQETSGVHRAAVAELRAVWCALDHLHSTGTPSNLPIEVHLDSFHALTFLQEWAHGGSRMPDGYLLWRQSGAVPTLERLRQTVALRATTLTFRHEQGHAGNTLNEAADTLAKLALRCSNGLIPQDLPAGLARRYAEQNLAAYLQELPGAGGSAST